MSTPHVVIVGGGFGGLEAAKALRNAPVNITLIDRRNHHVFQPLLYQVATAGLNPADIAYPIRSVLRKQPNATVLLGEVSEVDVGDSRVLLSDGEIIGYDYLIIATGATHSYFGNNHWEANAPGLKTIEDALEIRRRVLTAFERAERSADSSEQTEQLTFVIVGGGPTGVELAGAIAEIAFKVMARDFRRIDPQQAKVILLEGADRVLTPYPERLSVKAEDQLRRLGVDVRTGVMVTNVSGTGVETSVGPIAARTVIWSAGVAGSVVTATLGAAQDRAGRTVVEPDLSLASHPEVFVVGDAASAVSAGQPVPGVAQGAMQGGQHAASCVLADLSGTPRGDFTYRNKGELATIGRSSAVGVIGRFQLSGWVAWMAWWLVHVAFLIGFRSRAVVLFSWSWSYLTFQRGARLITSAWKSRSSGL